MPGDEDPGLVHLGHGPEKVCGPQWVGDALLYDGDGLDQLGSELLCVVSCTFLEPHYGDARAGEPPRKVLERTIWADLLVPVVGSGAVDQDHRWKRALARWDRQCPRERPLVGSDRHLTLGEAVWVGI